LGHGDLWRAKFLNPTLSPACCVQRTSPCRATPPQSISTAAEAALILT